MIQIISHSLFSNSVNNAPNGMMRGEQWIEKDVKLVVA
jgi:hypothetical protein